LIEQNFKTSNLVVRTPQELVLASYQNFHDLTTFTNSTKYEMLENFQVNYQTNMNDLFKQNTISNTKQFLTVLDLLTVDALANFTENVGANVLSNIKENILINQYTPELNNMDAFIEVCCNNIQQNASVATSDDQSYAAIQNPTTLNT
jgi:hypothetical protein